MVCGSWCNKSGSLDSLRIYGDFVFQFIFQWSFLLDLWQRIIVFVKTIYIFSYYILFSSSLVGK